MKRVVVTGVGSINPCGNNVAQTWKTICEGKGGVRRMEEPAFSNLPVHISAPVSSFEPEEHLSRKEQRRMDRFTQFAMVAAREAVAQSGLSTPMGDRTGIYIGTGIGGIREIEQGHKRMQEQGYRGLGALFIPKSLANLSGGHLAMAFGATGPNLCISTACAAGNHSIGEAFYAIRSDRADVIIAGGAEAAITPLGVGGFAVMKALSRRNDDPATASRPFDNARDGFVMGEGAGIVILESLEHAQQRGAAILAEVVGYAQNNDAHHISQPKKRHAGAAACMRLALKVAGIRPENIDYINAHGTSTASNDVNEAQAIADVFGTHPVYVSSTKGATGHLLGAAGGLEAVICVRALQEGLMPPTINIDQLDPQVDVSVVANLPIVAPLRYVLSNAFGFGGTNACVIFKRWGKE